MASITALQLLEIYFVTLYAQLTRNLLAIVKFLVDNVKTVGLSSLKQHNIVSFAEIVVKLSVATYT